MSCVQCLSIVSFFPFYEVPYTIGTYRVHQDVRTDEALDDSGWRGRDLLRAGNPRKLRSMCAVEISGVCVCVSVCVCGEMGRRKEGRKEA